MDRPDYRTALNVCLNAFPTEQGSWARRPGFRNCRTTRNGLPGRLFSFDFKQAAPYTLEFTSGHLRFRIGPELVHIDARTINSISSANPAKVATAPLINWLTGDEMEFHFLGTNNPLLQNRVFTMTVTSATEFTIADSITGAGIDGATLGTFVSGLAGRVLDFATPYVGTLWSTLRVVQCDIPTTNDTTPGAVLLHSAIKPYELKVLTPQIDSTTAATFSFGPVVFKDGPYFDPIPGGTLATPSALIGDITLTLSFPAYDAARSYSVGDYVLSGGVNYKSLQDANLNHVPAANPTFWVAVSAADAVGPNGFQGTDAGRMIRLYSEPAIWVAGTTYAAGNVVAYGGTGNAYVGATYWKSLAGSNTGNIPGVDLTKWALFPTGAIWTWGRIIGLSNIIDRVLAGSASIGNMTSGGGLAAAFDGTFSKTAATSAELTGTSGAVTNGTLGGITSFVGKNYSAASDQTIAQATVYPSSDFGLAAATAIGPGRATIYNITLNLRGKASAPANSADGTLIGQTVLASSVTTPVAIISTDLATAWKYVWVEQITFILYEVVPGNFATFNIGNSIAQVSLFNAPGSGSSQGVTVQIVGDALLYTTPIRSWRLGLYSDTTGWPTCGTYHEGRLWLSGVIANRIDSSKSNDIFNFAPTNPDGSVSGNNGISYTFNAPTINPIFWLAPDAQGIVCGTQGGEWLVQATQQNVPLTPTTIQAHQVTTNNCANIEPRRTDLTQAVVQVYQRELLEYFADVYSSKFTAQDLTWSGKHLTAAGIAEIAYQQELNSIIWARMGDGSLKGCTYKRKSLVSSQEPEMRGWHRHTHGGGRTVESICMAATADGRLPVLAMVTNDTAGVRHVEMATKMLEETDALADAWMLDDSIEPSSTVNSLAPITGAPYGGLTLNGLWHLNGKSVDVFAGGLDCGNPGEGHPIVTFTVTNGSIFIPYGDSISAGSGQGLFTPDFAASGIRIVVGFTYNSDGQIVRANSPAESGSRNGPAFGKLRRTHYVSFAFINAVEVKFGTDFTQLLPAQFRTGGGRKYTPLQVFTGIYRDQPKDEDSFDGMLCWRVARPYPLMISAAGQYLHTKDV